SIAAAGRRVFAGGNAGTVVSPSAFDPRSNLDAFVRGIDAHSGATVWEDRVDVGYFDRFQQVAADEDRVFVGGWVRSQATSVGFLVRAYDARTGRRLWQALVDKSGRPDFSEALIVQGGRVFAGGQVRNAANSTDFYVRAMDAKTGKLLWEDQL